MWMVIAVFLFLTPFLTVAQNINTLLTSSSNTINADLRIENNSSRVRSGKLDINFSVKNTGSSTSASTRAYIYASNSNDPKNRNHYKVKTITLNRMGRYRNQNVRFSVNWRKSYKYLHIYVDPGINYDTNFRNNISTKSISSGGSTGGGNSSNTSSPFKFNNISGTKAGSCGKNYYHPKITNGRFGRAWINSIYKDNVNVEIVTCQSYAGMCGTIEIRKGRVDGPLVAKTGVSCSSRGTKANLTIKTTREMKIFAVLKRNDGKTYFLGEMDVCTNSKCPPKMNKNYYQLPSGGSATIAPMKQIGNTSNGGQIMLGVDGARWDSRRNKYSFKVNIYNRGRTEFSRGELKAEIYTSSDAKFTLDDRKINTISIGQMRRGRSEHPYVEVYKNQVPSNIRHFIVVIKEARGGKIVAVYYNKKN